MEIIGLIGYGLMAISYLMFLLLLITARQKIFSSQTIIFACLACVISAALSATQLYLSYSLQLPLLFESIKLAMWSLLLFSLNKGLSSFSDVWAHKSFKQYLVIWLGFTIAGIISVAYLQQYHWVFIILLALNLLALVLLEQLYRNHKEQMKWAIWPLTAGLGSIFVFDFVMYAQGSLINHLDFDFWYARGYLGVIALPLLVLSAKRIKGLSPELFISRDVVFYSSILLFSGGYLLLLAFSGYVIRFIGGQWSGVLSMAFMLLGALVLFVLLITTTLRNKVKVFIGKHFFANKYDYRIEWLKLINTIAKSGSENISANACKAMSSCMQVQYCAFIKVKNGQVDIVYQDNINFSVEINKQFQVIDTFCQKQHWIIDIREYRSEPSTYQNLTVDAGVLIAAGIAVIVPTYNQEQLLGYFILSAPAQKPLLNWEDRDYLFAVSQQLGNYLSLQHAQVKLAQSQQFSAFHRMSAFVLHDLKNIQAQLSLITTNAKQHQQNPEFIEDVFSTVESASQRLSKVVQQLKLKTTSNESSVHANNNQTFNLHSALQNIQFLCNQRQPQVSVNCAHDLCLTIDQEGFNNVLLHLTENAQQASDTKQTVLITCSLQEDRMLIKILDKGCGMDAEYIANQLFQPFCTTKGNSGMGIGVFAAKQFIEESGGLLQVESEVQKGSIFTINLPSVLVSQGTVLVAPNITAQQKAEGL